MNAVFPSSLKISNKLFLIEQLRWFIRFETAFYILGLGFTGFFLFKGSLVFGLPLFLTITFSNFAIYSYNHMTDKAEDEINDLTINYFTAKDIGKLFVLAFLSLSIISAAFLPLLAFIAYLFTITASMFYSFFRIKKYFLIAQLYTSITLASVFIIGSLTAETSIINILFYLPLFLLYGFSTKLRGDISGFEGDKNNDINTIAVKFGKNNCIRVLHVVIFSMMISIFSFYQVFFPIIALLVLASLFLMQKNLKITRALLLSALGVMALILMVMS